MHACNPRDWESVRKAPPVEREAMKPSEICRVRGPFCTNPAGVYTIFMQERWDDAHQKPSRKCLYAGRKR
jgi:hypothetical protein